VGKGGYQGCGDYVMDLGSGMGFIWGFVTGLRELACGLCLSGRRRKKVFCDIIVWEKSFFVTKYH
jgi:hypothetical protein